MSAFRYLQNLPMTGSLCPSSKRLAEAVYQVALRNRESATELVFAGIGSGVIARRFLHWDQSTIFVDIDRAFCADFALQVHRQEHRVVCGDIADILRAAPGSHGRIVISCLPLQGLYYSERVLTALLREVQQGAQVLFYSYVPLWRWTRFCRTLHAASVEARRERIIVRNLPPAFVYSLALRACVASSAGASNARPSAG